MALLRKSPVLNPENARMMAFNKLGDGTSLKIAAVRMGHVWIHLFRGLNKALTLLSSAGLSG